jgi:uncharacterized protein (TIGR02246 family)
MMSEIVVPRTAAATGWFLRTSAISEEEAAANQARDAAKIRATVRRLFKSWADGDGAAYAAEFTEDADYVAFDGTHLKGQFENAELHDELFQTVLRGSRLVGEVEGVRFVSDDVAVVQLTGAVVFAWQRMATPDRMSRQTMVMVRQLGAWRIAAFHNTRIRPMPRGGAMVRLFSLYVRLRSWMAKR